MLQKICRQSGLPFESTAQEKAAYERFGLPISDLHPMVRFRGVNAWLNAYNLYWAKDGRTGKQVMTNLDPANFPVIYENAYWMSADFDARDYGRDFDFSRGFFEQWAELFRAVPQPNLTTTGSEDCAYSNYVANCKACYLLFHGPNCERVHVSALAFNSKDSIELFNSYDCERCFQCVFSKNCYDVRFAVFALNCHSSSFLYDCVDCDDCYQCVNLKHKRYCLQNKQYSKEEYEAIMAKINLGSYQQLQTETKRWHEFLVDKPLRAQRNINCQNSDGTQMVNCVDCHHCFTLSDSINCYNTIGYKAEDCCDTAMFDGRRATFAQGGMNSSDVYFTWLTIDTYNIAYSMMMFNSHDCFGCYGLKQTSYCIFNKQYTPEAYEALKAKIIVHMQKTGEWGRWFPEKDSPFPYDDSTADVICPPISEHEFKVLGLHRSNRAGAGPATGPVSTLPDMVTDTDERVCRAQFVCEKTGRGYQIDPSEYTFHTSMNIALPRWHWRPRIEAFYGTSVPLPVDGSCAQCKQQMLVVVDPLHLNRPLWCDECFFKDYGG